MGVGILSGLQTRDGEVGTGKIWGLPANGRFLSDVDSLNTCLLFCPSRL